MYIGAHIYTYVYTHTYHMTQQDRFWKRIRNTLNGFISLLFILFGIKELHGNSLHHFKELVFSKRYLDLQAMK